MTAHAAPEVHILMGLFNGQDHLPAQLQSIAAQSHDRWRLTCSDDGSSDATRDIVRDFAGRTARSVTLQDGPQQGFAANYLGLLRALPEAPGLVALADQDDVWLPEKLARAAAHLATADPARPTLYCSRILVWHPDIDQRVASPPLRRPASFRNALIENIAPGNTIVLNPAAARLARDAARCTDDVFAHDWWLYLLVSGAGGQVIHDDHATLLYRQHDRNVLGSGRGWRQQLGRKLAVLRGAFRDRQQQNITSLRCIETVLTPETRATLDAFARARNAPLPSRMLGLGRLGLYRQSALSTLSFWGGALLGRI